MPAIDTGGYFVAAYVAAAALYLGYAASLFRRRRAVRARLARLERVEQAGAPGRAEH